MKKGKSRNKRKKTRSRLLWIAIAVIGNSCGNFCSMCGRNVGNKGKCLEDTGRTSGGVHGSYSKTGV